MKTETNSDAGSGCPGATCSADSVRAFCVECHYFRPPITSIVRSTSAARAKFKVWESANEVGYKVEFGDLTVKRDRRFDAAKLIKDRCYALDFAESILEPNSRAHAREP